MSITWQRGDLLNDTADSLVNCVNCVGVMGAGIAAMFKLRFPSNYEAYRYRCTHAPEKLLPGEIFYHRLADGRRIYNLATKGDFRDPSRLQWIREGLGRLAYRVMDDGVQSIAVPALGCGRGGLAWSDVRPLIEHYLGDAMFQHVDVRVYEPMEGS
ncbi:MAG TPA: macro domain-containing protein [Thermoanaerobaculia bacterium]|nr:macro domain-containing protein [Thermoanaerobaculia bacterium]